MPRIEVTITTPDGECPATLHVPGGAPAPAVILYPDAGGARETMRLMADRLAAAGYVTLLPDVYYRSGGWEPFDMTTAFSDPNERDRLMRLARSVTAEMTDSDAGAFLDFLARGRRCPGPPWGPPATAWAGVPRSWWPGAIPNGSVRRPRSTAAGSPSSTTRSARTCSPSASAPPCTSPRRRTTTPSLPTRSTGCESAFESAGVGYTMETYPAAHGFAVPDNPTHDPAAEERHWSALTRLFDANLRA